MNSFGVRFPMHDVNVPSHNSPIQPCYCFTRQTDDYEIQTVVMNKDGVDILSFWGKARPRDPGRGPDWHPLVFHWTISRRSWRPAATSRSSTNAAIGASGGKHAQDYG